MKKIIFSKFRCFIFIALIMFVISGIVIGSVDNSISAYASNGNINEEISSEEIEISIIDKGENIEIIGHYYDKKYCARITYVLEMLFPELKIELNSGYAKYIFNNDLLTTLNNIKDDEYFVWKTEEYEVYAQSLNDSDYLFWFTDVAEFQDKYGQNYRFLAVQYSGVDDTDERVPIYDRYGNYTYGDGAWIMPVQARSHINAGNLDIDVIINDEGWRIVNTGNMICKVKCLVNGVEISDYSLYYDYPQEKQYVLSQVINLNNVESVTLKESFEVTLQNNKIIGTEFIKEDNMIGFKNSDGSKIIAYFSKNSNYDEGWYYGIKKQINFANNIKLSTTLFNNSVEMMDTKLSEIDNYNFTKVNDAPSVKVTDEETSNFSAFLKANSVSLPHTGILFTSENYILPLVVIGVMLIICLGLLVFVLKKKPMENNMV